MQPAVSRRSLIEAVVASTVGTTIEWYDFFLFNMALLIFRPQFFPGNDWFASQLPALLTITVGFIARPIGGVVFGYMGDRVGRKSALVSTLLLMGISTVLIGFLPTYNQIGIAAPILLTLLRFLQGLGVGGEWGGAVLLALEYSQTGKRGFYASWPQAGVPLGMLTSTGVLAFFKWWLPHDDFLAWGWRIPFYLSALLIVVGMLIRMRILETPLFTELKKQDAVAEAPVRETLVHHWREVLLVAGSRFIENAGYYVVTLFTVWYADQYGPAGLRDHMMRAIAIGAALSCFTIPFFGFMADHWTRRRTYIAGCVFWLLFAFPLFWALQSLDPLWITLAIVLGMTIGHATLYSVQASLIPELFSTRVRCTGASIGYQLGAVFSGGIVMPVSTYLDRSLPGVAWPLATYMIFYAVTSIACVYALSETSRKDIGDVPHASV